MVILVIDELSQSFGANVAMEIVTQTAALGQPMPRDIFASFSNDVYPATIRKVEPKLPIVEMLFAKALFLSI